MSPNIENASSPTPTASHPMRQLRSRLSVGPSLTIADDVIDEARGGAEGRAPGVALTASVEGASGRGRGDCDRLMRGAAWCCSLARRSVSGLDPAAA